MGFLKAHMLGIVVVLVLTIGSYNFVNDFLSLNTNNERVLLSEFNQSKNFTAITQNAKDFKEQLTAATSSQNFLQTIFVASTAGTQLMFSTILTSIDVSVSIFSTFLSVPAQLIPELASGLDVATAALVAVLSLSFAFAILTGIIKVEI